MTNQWYEMKAARNNSADIYIYGDIVGSSSTPNPDELSVSAKSFKKDLEALGDVNTLNVYINSYGGNVFDGIAIYSQLKRHPAHVNVYIDGVAASIASIIVMAADTVYMPANTLLMIHKPWVTTSGNSDSLRKSIQALDHACDVMITAYLEKAGEHMDRETLEDLLQAETWMNARDAVKYGFADVIIDDVPQLVASISEEAKAHFKHIPAELTEPKENDHAERLALLAEIKNIPNTNYYDTMKKGIY